jgi:hypothetical protein
LKMARATAAAARKSPPKSKDIAVLTGGGEPALENRFTHRLVEAWRSHGARVSTHELPASGRLPHDLIDLSHPSQSNEGVYPVMTRLIEGEPPA